MGVAVGRAKSAQKAKTLLLVEFFIFLAFNVKPVFFYGPKAKRESWRNDRSERASMPHEETAGIGGDYPDSEIPYIDQT